MSFSVRAWAAISVVLVSVVNAQFSPLSTKGFGLKVPNYNIQEIGMGHSGSAYITGGGSSIYGMAKAAFNTRTTFQAIFQTDLTYLEDNSNSNTLSSSNLPFIGLNFQAGWLGNLGVIYHQKYIRNYSFAPAAGGNNNLSNNFEGGPFELIYSLSRQFTPRFSLGLGYMQLLGRDRVIKKVAFEEPDFRDLTGDTTLTKTSGGAPAISGMYRHKKFNLNLYGTLPGKIVQSSGKHIDNIVAGEARKTTYDFPLALALGLNYKHSRSTNYTLDFSTEDWGGVDLKDLNRSFHVGAGYEYQGQGGRYRPYYTNMAYRAGLGFERHYILEANEYRLTGGLGFPLGRRGSVLDLAMELGQQGSLDVQNYRSGFVKLYIGLTGAGLWGETRRRY